jgi:hypothetical protein
MKRFCGFLAARLKLCLKQDGSRFRAKDPTSGDETARYGGTRFAVVRSSVDHRVGERLIAGCVVEVFDHGGLACGEPAQSLLS